MTYFVFYLLIGAVAGTLSGLLGIGGGVVIVPLLILIFAYIGIPSAILVQMAVATSLATIVVSTFSSAHKHYLMNNIDYVIAQRMWLPVLLGALLGTIIADFMPGHFLRVCVATVITALAIHILFVRTVPNKQSTFMSSPWFLALSGFFACIGAMVGAGGGIFFMPLLLSCGMTTMRSLATSSIATLMVAIVSTVSYGLLGLHQVHFPWSSGYVYWPAFAGIALSSFFFARFGIFLANFLPLPVTRKIFAVLLILVAVHMIYAVIN